MIRNVLQLAEILAVLFCLSGLFGQKMKFDICAVVLIIADLFLFTGINEYGFPVYLSSLAYVGLFLYCVMHYKEKIRIALINCFLAVVMVSILQLIFYLPVFYLFVEREGVNPIYECIINLLCLLTFIIIKDKLKLQEIALFFIKRNKLTTSIAVLIMLIWSRKIYQVSTTGAMSEEDYAQIIYYFLLLFIIIYNWQKARADAERKKTQLEMNRLYFDAYEELIALVRMRQHDMKNHITAILGMIYTIDNYDELIQKQREYCDLVLKSNEKTKILLSVENPLIAGFLYRKIQEAEEKEIKVEYHIDLRETKFSVTEYEIVEMLGILLDNAMEALENTELEKRILISIVNNKNETLLSVANASPIYDMNKISSFFEFNFSEKGKGRGIGLYKLKRLVNSRKGDIIITNEMHHQVNYLRFDICFKKEID